jgi:cell division protein FtsQ
VAEKGRRRAPARVQALPLAERRPRVARTARWLPSARSVAIGCSLLALAGGAYLVALKTPVFALQRIQVEGAPPALADQIRSALTPLEGTSLVSFSRSDADRRLAGIPQIASVGYDRDFPHTLRVKVSVERPVAVLRKASDGWLVSSTGRVLAALRPGSYPPLPRIWLAAQTDVSVGASVETGDAIAVAAALPAAHLPAHVLAVRDDGGGRLVAQLAGGREIRLGDLSNLAVKLAVAAAVLPHARDALYVDVSVPTRPVAGYSTAPPSNLQVSGQG